MIYTVHSHAGLMLPMQLAALRRFIPDQSVTVVWAPPSADPKYGAGPLRIDERWVMGQYVNLIEAPPDLVGYVGVHRVRALYRWLWQSQPRHGRWTVLMHGDVIPVKPIGLAGLCGGCVMAGCGSRDISTAVRIFDNEHHIAETWEGAPLMGGSVDGRPFKSLPLWDDAGHERIGPFAHMRGMSGGEPDVAQRRNRMIEVLGSRGIDLPTATAPTVAASEPADYSGEGRRVGPWPDPKPLWLRPGDLLRRFIFHATDGKAKHGVACELMRAKMNAGGWGWCWRHRREVMARMVNEARQHFAPGPNGGAVASDEWHPLAAWPTYLWLALRHWSIDPRPGGA